MKRNISTHRDDKPARLSCGNCGDHIGIIPAGFVVTSRSRSTRTKHLICGGCGEAQSIHFGQSDA